MQRSRRGNRTTQLTLVTVLYGKLRIQVCGHHYHVPCLPRQLIKWKPFLLKQFITLVHPVTCSPTRYYNQSPHESIPTAANNPLSVAKKPHVNHYHQRNQLCNLQMKLLKSVRWHFHCTESRNPYIYSHTQKS